MPKITVGDLDINYKIQGSGEPLLMIIGLSFSLLDWGIKLPELLSQYYKVILFDNRDAGETNVFGVSMGGMIAIPNQSPQP